MALDKRFAANRTRIGETLEFRSSDGMVGRRLHGLAVPYNVSTVINEGGYRFRERVAPGAFKLSIRHHDPSHFPCLLAHDTRSLPVGRYTALRETEAGLEVEGEIFASREDVREAVEANTLRMSVGFRPLDEYFELNGKRLEGSDVWRELGRPGQLVDRVITTAALREVSLCALPAYESTYATVRSGESSTTTISVSQAKEQLLRLEL